MGFPIRTSADQRSLASPRGFSQRATSFIASWRQGIHRTLLSRSIHHQRPYAGPSPTSKHQQLNQNAQQFSLSIQPTNPIHLSNSMPPNPDPLKDHRPDSHLVMQRRAAWVTARPQPNGNQPRMETVGIEPTTPCLQSRCSPTELRPRKTIPGRAAGQAPPKHRGRHPILTAYPAPGRRMGQGGLEPPTPRLSSVCSNQLSYWPSPQQATLRQPMPGPTQPANPVSIPCRNARSVPKQDHSRPRHQPASGRLGVSS